MTSILHEHFLNIFQKNNHQRTVNYHKTKAAENLDKLSSLGFKYPKLRDHPLHTSHQWLESKRIDDGAEGFWRIHNKLYDLENFIKAHPGGEDWIRLTKGTDITEAFESHHLSDLPESLLNTYYVREASLPRNSPFTFKPNDFYKVLKKKMYKKLNTLPDRPKTRTKYLTDMLFISYVGFALGAAYLQSFVLGAISGVCLALTANAAHNFFHQKDNFRMYYFDFSFMQSREWRISHAISHHLYTNTIQDMEIASLEPFLQYLPMKKNIFFRYISWLYSPIVYMAMFIVQYIRGVAQRILLGQMITFEFVLPFIVPVLMWAMTRQPLVFCVSMYAWIITISSIYFGLVGVNAAHHHPDIFHDGDLPRSKDEMDWGIYQLDAVADRSDITGSHFLVLTNFGDHALHHLFPTIDHGLLEYLYPEFLETIQEFGLEWKLTTQIEMVKGQFRQLARIKPNLVPRSSVKEIN